MVIFVESRNMPKVDSFTGGAPDIGRKGKTQNILTTMEMGFGPFVPFSEFYKMKITSAKSSLGNLAGMPDKTMSQLESNQAKSWKFMPADGEGFTDSKWGNRVSGWREMYNYFGPKGQGVPAPLETVDPLAQQEYIQGAFDGGVSMTENRGAVRVGGKMKGKGARETFDAGSWAAIANLLQLDEHSFKAAEQFPRNDAAGHAARIAEELSAILNKPVIKAPPGSVGKTVKEEAENVNLMHELTQGDRPKIEGGAGQRKSGYGFNLLISENGWDAGMSSQGLDLAATNTAAAAQLGLTQQTLNKVFKTSAFSGIIGIETTTSQTEKFFNKGLKKVLGDKTGKDRRKAFENEMIKRVKKIEALAVGKNQQGKNLKGLYTKLGMKPESESLKYITKQFIDRFGRIEVEQGMANSTTDSFAYSMPITNTEIGYLIITPELDNGMLTKINTQVFYLPMDDMAYPEWMEPYLRLGAGSVPEQVAMHSNVMLLHAINNSTMSDVEMLTMVDEAFQNSVNMHSAFRQQRTTMAGSILATDVDLFMGGTVGSVPQLTAMEILSSTAAAKVIKEQVYNFALGKSNEMETVLRNAYTRANLITARWKNRLGPMGKPPFDGIFGPPYVGRFNMKGAGAPFWMTMGRDPFAFKAFMGGKVPKYKDWTHRRLIHKVIDGTPVGRRPDIVDALKLTDLWRQDLF